MVAGDLFGGLIFDLIFSLLSIFLSGLFFP
jgi:hypothetical protein